MDPILVGISALGLRSKDDPAVPHYPPYHKAAMKVPIGGSMCANCRHLSTDQKHCTEPNFIAWEGENKPAGSDVIPGEIDAYCSDFYEPAKGTMGK